MPPRMKELSGRLFGTMDRSLLRGSALVTAGMIASRGLGFLASMAMARLFEPKEFGIIQYSIALANIAAIMIVPFGQHVLARYIGMNRDSPADLRQSMSNAWVILAGLSIFSFGLAIPVLHAAGRFNPGIPIMLLGTSLFYVYWGLSRGFMASGRLALAEIGNNSVRLALILVLIAGLGFKSTFLAMVIQGMSCFIPLALLQHLSPLPAVYERGLVSWPASRKILRFALPVWLSHASYVLCASLPLVFLERFHDKATVGVFSLAVTLSNIFLFIPAGFATMLLAKIAGSKSRDNRGMVLTAALISLIGNGGLLAAYALAAPALIGRLFGAKYLVSPGIFIIMAAATALAGFHDIVTALYVGGGMPQVETRSRLAALVVIVAGCELLIPKYGAPGAAWVALGGIASGLFVYGISLAARSRTRTATQQIPAAEETVTELESSF